MSKKNFLMTLLALFFCLSPAIAQKKKEQLPDKSIVGVWILQEMQYKGEEKIVCGKTYSSVKYYGPTGEYACAEITSDGKGNYLILPHEYGTYTYNNGEYTEMGRKSNLGHMGKGVMDGWWFNRHDFWKKTTIPESLLKEIILRCKANQTPSKEIQDQIHKYILNK